MSRKIIRPISSIWSRGYATLPSRIVRTPESVRLRTPVSLADYGLDKVTQEAYADKMDMHKSIVAFRQLGYRGQPKPGRCFIAPTATIAGNVEVWDFSSIWYNAVVRGDRNLVRIGHHSNVQESTVISEAFEPIGPDHDGSTIIGHYVTIGHRCIIRAATVENICLIGMGSILSEGSYVSEGSILGAGTVLLPGVHVAKGELWVGNPGRKLRDVTVEELNYIVDSAYKYAELADEHADAFPKDYPLYLQAEKEGLI